MRSRRSINFTLALLMSICVLAVTVHNPRQLSSSNIVYVDDDNNSGIEDGSIHFPYNTIQEGVDAASSGDTVYVFSGLYNGNVILNKTIKLIGEDKNTTTIDAGQYGDVVSVMADHILVEGFNITGCGWATGDAGIELKLARNCDIVNNRIVLNNNYGIYFRDCHSNNIIGNDISTNYQHGIFLHYSNGNNIIVNNISSNNQIGIYFYYSNSNNISNNNMFQNGQCSFHLYYSINNILSGNVMIDHGILLKGNKLEYWNTHNIDTSNTINGNPVYYWKNQTGGIIPLGAGQIILANCQNVNIENQEINNGPVDILLGFSLGNNITGNKITNNDYGIYLFYSDGNIIAGNNLSSNFIAGVFLAYSKENHIFNNYLFFNKLDGIYVQHYSDENTITHNIISYNNNGIYLDFSKANKLSNNTMNDNGIFLRGGLLEHWTTHDIDTSNTVNGKPVYYWKDRIQGTIPPDTGQVILGNCHYIRIENQELISGSVGIELGFSTNNNITDNNLTNNNLYGVYLSHSSNNTIYHNNIIDNKNQGYDDRTDNYWDGGWPMGGNYWNDYHGRDWYYGPDQDLYGSDGVGDTPYLIGPIIMQNESKDRYPLIRPWRPPVAYPGPDQTVFEGEVIRFNGSGSFSPYGYIDKYEWDLNTNVDTDGDGNPINDIDVNGSMATHIYGDDGVYNVTLSIKTGVSGSILDKIPQDVIFCVDTSGSMTTESIDLVKNGLILYTNEMSLPDRGAVVVFNNEVYLINNHHLTDNYTQLKDDIAMIPGPGGATYMGEALQIAIDELLINRKPDHRQVIILLTDGCWNGNVDPLYPTDIAAINDINIFTIGLEPGLGHLPLDEVTLREIANRTSGIYYYAPDASYLSAIYQEISQIVNFSYVVELSDINTMKVTVNNSPPSIEPFGPFEVDEGSTLTITTTANDPGSDDITFIWEFETLPTITNVYYNDDIGSDPYPSPEGIFPFSATDTISNIYDKDGNYTIILNVTDDDGGIAIYKTYVIVKDIPENEPPSIESINYKMFKNIPRTIGYWKHQCKIEEPYGDHTGILQEWIDNISSQSQVFSWISTKNDVEGILEKGSAKDMEVIVKRQLLALWLNLVSGKVHPTSGVDLPSLTISGTLLETIYEIENVIITTDNREELERIKDIADRINNGMGIARAYVEFYGIAIDSDPDDLTFKWDFGDGKIEEHFYPNLNGTYPVVVADYIGHSYFSLGTFTVVLTVIDDEDGYDIHSIIINLP